MKSSALSLTARSLLALTMTTSLAAAGQPANPPQGRVRKAEPAALPSRVSEQPPAESPDEARIERRRTDDEQKPVQSSEGDSTRNVRFDMTERAPVQTHHQIVIGGKTIRYTATAGRLPIKDLEGKIGAEMFYVAYTADGVDISRRPLTFAFNGGPGSASLWLHMGALGPRKVVLQPEGWLPAAPYRMVDNASSPIDVTDLVVVDAIGTGFSRPADAAAGKKYWNVRGDIEAFGEFIRLYLSRNDRWSSPLYLLGESYGTTRAAGIAGYLSERGINFSGVMLLSEVLSFETLEFAKTNDVPYPLILPTYTMIAAYHHKLAPELMADVARTREEATAWALGPYWQALNRGDSLSAEERDAVAAQLARYTGLPKDVIDLVNLRIDVGTFTRWLLADQKLRVGRLDGRFTGPDPTGGMDTSFFDPTSAQTGAPFTSTFNDYVGRELGYKVDMPYYTSARDSGMFAWVWVPPPDPQRRGGFEMGYPDTGAALRSAMVRNPWLKVLVMEGYYDLATPFAAANYTMQHLDLPPSFRKNISYATYDSGHMVYLESKSLEKFKNDVASFIQSTSPK